MSKLINSFKNESKYLDYIKILHNIVKLTHTSLWLESKMFKVVLCI